MFALQITSSLLCIVGRASQIAQAATHGGKRGQFCGERTTAAGGGGNRPGGVEPPRESVPSVDCAGNPINARAKASAKLRLLLRSTYSSAPAVMAHLTLSRLRMSPTATTAMLPSAARISLIAQMPGR